MYVRKLAAAAGFACGAALVFAPFASADLSNDAAGSAADSLIYGLSPAAVTPTPIDLDISFDGYTLYDGGGTAVANTGAAGNGLYDFAIAYGAGANATAEGGYGNYALASGTNALAHAGSMTTGATGFNFNVAEDIGNNTAGGPGAPDGAYAGGGSLLLGDHDSAGASSNNAAYLFGNTGPTGTGAETAGGNSGSFAGDGQLINVAGAGSGNTAYTAGNILGENDGSAAVAGNNNLASSSGNETGNNEGGFAGLGNNNTAIADANYTHTGDGVSAIAGNGNYAYVYGPDNSTASAGGTSTAIGETATHLGNNNVAYVYDPYGMTGAADSATAGSSGTASGNSDLAEVLLTHGNASATGANNLYDIISLFGNSHSASLPAEAAAAVPAAATPITSLFDSEVTSLNSQFEFEALLAGDYGDVTKATAPGVFDTIAQKDTPYFPTTDTTDASKVTALEDEIYGSNPIKAGISMDTGPFNLFNGAEAKLDDAYNVATYALLNHGALDTSAADYIGNLPTGFSADTPAQAFEYFYNFAVGDLGGFFQTDLSGFDISATSANELFNLLGSL